MAFLRETEKVNTVNEEEELRKHGYTLGATLGEGSYAKVKAAFSERNQCKVAIKVINKRRAPKDFLNKFLPRELEVLKKVRHPNVTRLFEILYFNHKVFIAMELAGHGDLLDYVKLRGPVPEDRSRVMFSQLISAIKYLHSMHIVHRDLKCENILLDGENNIKVSDFGFARTQMSADDLSRTFCGSAAYAAPEILQGIPYYGPAYDIWSCGVILYIMVCGSMPFDDSNIKKMIKFQNEKKVSFNRHKEITQNCKELIWMILEANPLNRASTSMIERSNWMLMSPTKPNRPTISSGPVCTTIHRSTQNQPPQQQKQVLQLNVVRQHLPKQSHFDEDDRSPSVLSHRSRNTGTEDQRSQRPRTPTPNSSCTLKYNVQNPAPVSIAKPPPAHVHIGKAPQDRVRSDADDTGEVEAPRHPSFITPIPELGVVSSQTPQYQQQRHAPQRTVPLPLPLPQRQAPQPPPFQRQVQPASQRAPAPPPQRLAPPGLAQQQPQLPQSSQQQQQNPPGRANIFSASRFKRRILGPQAPLRHVPPLDNRPATSYSQRTSPPDTPNEEEVQEKIQQRLLPDRRR